MQDSKNFLNDDGSWKEFKIAKEDVGKIYYSKLLTSIEKNYRSNHGILDNKLTKKDNFYAKNRFNEYIKMLRDKAIKGDNDFIRRGDVEKSVLNQWNLVKNRINVKFSDSMDKEIFDLKEEFSDFFSVGSESYFYKKLGENLPEDNFDQMMNEGQKILGDEGKKTLMKYILSELKGSL